MNHVWQKVNDYCLCRDQAIPSKIVYTYQNKRQRFKSLTVKF